MDALIENNEVFSTNENTTVVPAANEQVQEVSIEETVTKGNRIEMIQGMDEIGREAEANGLTEELIDEILAES